MLFNFKVLHNLENLSKEARNGDDENNDNNNKLQIINFKSMTLQEGTFALNRELTECKYPDQFSVTVSISLSWLTIR